MYIKASTADDWASMKLLLIFVNLFYIIPGKTDVCITADEATKVTESRVI